MKLHDDYHNHVEDIFPNERDPYIRQLFVEIQRHIESALTATARVRLDHLPIITRSLIDKIQAEDPEELVSQFWFAQARNHTKDAMGIFDKIESVASRLAGIPVVLYFCTWCSERIVKPKQYNGLRFCGQRCIDEYQQSNF